MENSNQSSDDLSLSKDNTSMIDSSFLSSFISPSMISMNSFEKIKNEIKDIFETQIKPLVSKFSIDSYESKSRDIRNLIIKLRKLYYKPQNENKESSQSNQSKNPTQAQTSNQQISNQNNSNSNQNQIMLIAIITIVKVIQIIILITNLILMQNKKMKI